MHGGVPQPRSIAQIRRIPAPFDPSGDSVRTEPRESGDREASELVADLLWPNPAGMLEESTCGGSAEGESAVRGVLAGNGLTHVLRAHNSMVEGVSVGKDARDIAICSTSIVGWERKRRLRDRDFEMGTRCVDAFWSMGKPSMRLTVRTEDWRRETSAIMRLWRRGVRISRN